jgi:hypothetical protein
MKSLTFMVASEDELYELIDKVDQCEIARQDKADAEIAQCKADHARESDSIRKAELIVQENQLIAANRDLCAQYEKEKADLRSAFQNANTVPTLPTSTANLTPRVDRDRSQATRSPKKSKRKRTWPQPKPSGQRVAVLPTVRPFRPDLAG